MRMTFLTTLTALALLALAAPAAATLDPDDPQDALKISRKVACSLEDGEAVTFYWTGSLYSRRQGERDKLLFDIEGMNVRACVSDTHPERGEGYRLISREIMLYKDPDTGEVLSTWENPWTGETVEVLHVANDPVNFATYSTGRGGEPVGWGGSIKGDMWRSSIEIPLWYPNPLGGKYQEAVGGTYHATEMFNFFGSTDNLLDEDIDSAKAHVGWTRISDWLPWMQMSGREGILYVHAAGLKLDSRDDLPETMKEEIRTHYPKYVSPPPLDDDRRNQTSWIYYKQVMEGQREAPDRN